jgi:hypothetical protein
MWVVGVLTVYEEITLGYHAGAKKSRTPICCQVDARWVRNTKVAALYLYFTLLLCNNNIEI